MITLHDLQDAHASGDVGAPIKMSCRKALLDLPESECKISVTEEAVSEWRSMAAYP